MKSIFRTKTKDMAINKVYGGVLVGEIQKDVEGKIWWKRAGGEVQQIDPHPNALWIETGTVEEKGFLKPNLTIVT